jgi:hypothetical protein
MSHAAQRLHRLREQALRRSELALGHALIVATTTDKTVPSGAVLPRFFCEFCTKSSTIDGDLDK